ncbi:hypothetical protein RIF29_16385 [Crotalaria pallida]|uniref:Uncharacterized protein n=1 Tax=Crotalaria pallida TaxID=3830 RepID=A0AAN9IEE8_CROPI
MAPNTPLGKKRKPNAASLFPSFPYSRRPFFLSTSLSRSPLEDLTLSSSKTTLISDVFSLLHAVSSTERTEEAAYKPLPGAPTTSRISDENASLLENIHWKALGLLFTVWIILLVLEIAKDFRKRWDRQSQAFYNLFRQADGVEKLAEIIQRLEQGDLKLRVRTLEFERAFQLVASIQKTIGNVSETGL